jgi:hypothetical protein
VGKESGKGYDQKNLTSDNATNKEIWELKTSDCWTTGKLTDR